MSEMTELQDKITAWHERAFGWATALDCLIKLSEENAEAMKAFKWDEGNLADELADCLIAIFAAAGRSGIDLRAAIVKKLPLVMAKHSTN
jgi:NTP pyrophosphatase (non-canonical NTP hydrolase)